MRKGAALSGAPQAKQSAYLKIRRRAPRGPSHAMSAATSSVPRYSCAAHPLLCRAPVPAAPTSTPMLQHPGCLRKAPLQLCAGTCGSANGALCLRRHVPLTGGRVSWIVKCLPLISAFGFTHKVNLKSGLYGRVGNKSTGHARNMAVIYRETVVGVFQGMRPCLPFGRWWQKVREKGGAQTSTLREEKSPARG